MRFVDRIDAVGTARRQRAGDVVRAGHRADRAPEFRRRQLRPPRPDRRRAPAGAADRRAARDPGALARGAAAAASGSRRSRIAASPPAPIMTARVAAAAAARAQAQGTRAQIGDRVIRAPFSGWVSLAQHLGRRDRQPGHRDRDDQRHQHDQARFHRARDDAGLDPRRASPSRRARPLIPTGRSTAPSTPSTRWSIPTRAR